MKNKERTESVKIPEGVTVKIEGHLVTATGSKGEVSRTFLFHGVDLKQEGDAITVSAKNVSVREINMVVTFAAHLKNMVLGVKEGHTYKLKICSGHFPMNVAVSSDKLVVKNFLGEKVPRVAKIIEGVKVKIDGEIITVESPDIEKSGQTAANMEQLTRITNRDLRIFQDGIYIIEKTGGNVL